MAAVNPYLTFNGNCGEAFDFYKLVFGREFSTISKFGDGPSDFQHSEKENEKILHVALPIGQGTVLMGSDIPESVGSAIIGQNFSLSISTETEEEATNIFNGLSAGGQVTMPLDRTFWNAYFGMLVDKFGIQWMINYDYK